MYKFCTRWIVASSFKILQKKKKTFIHFNHYKNPIISVKVKPSETVFRSTLCS